MSQVEGLADLINSETEAQRKQAQRVLSGELGRKVSEWRSDLIRAAALLEATIDFVDEAEFEFLKEKAFQLIEQTKKDHAAGIFKAYKSYTTSFNVTINSVEEGITFNNVHEGLHFGSILALRKLI